MYDAPPLSAILSIHLAFCKSWFNVRPNFCSCVSPLYFCPFSLSYLFILILSLPGPIIFLTNITFKYSFLFYISMNITNASRAGEKADPVHIVLCFLFLPFSILMLSLISFLGTFSLIAIVLYLIYTGHRLLNYDSHGHRVVS